MWELCGSLGKGEADLECCWLMPQGCPPASAPCLPHSPIHPVTPHLVLFWCWCQHPRSKASAPSQIWGWFGLKSNPAMYVCLSVRVWLKGSISPCKRIHGKAAPRSMLAEGQAGARGKWSKPRSWGGKYFWLILLSNIVSSGITALDQSSCMGACSLYLSRLACLYSFAYSNQQAGHFLGQFIAVKSIICSYSEISV